MRLPLRGWASVFEALGRFRRNRKQRRAAAARGRSMHYRLGIESLEPRLVLNAAPVAEIGFLTASEDDVDVGGAVSATDQDELDVLTYSRVDNVTNGTLSFNSDGTFQYTPNPNFYGSDSFSFFANDGTDDSNTATVTITVNPVNDPPTADDDSDSTHHGVPLEGGVSGDDIDEDELTYELVEDATNGSVSIDPSGEFVYTPNAGFVGDDSFTFRSLDGTDPSAPATFTVHVTNTAPTANDDSFPTVHNTPYDGTVGGDDEDAEDSLTFALVDDATNGSVTLNLDGTFTYTPDAGYVGPDSFTFVSYDGAEYSAPATISVTVTNETPEASDYNLDSGNNPLHATDEDVVYFGGGLLDDAYDADGDSLGANEETKSTANGGSVTIYSNGAFEYTPPADYHGTDSFTYTISDPWSTSAAATVTVTVAPVNDAPTITAGAYHSTLAAIDEDDADPVGMLVSDWLAADQTAGYVDDIDDDVLGVAIVDLNSNNEDTVDGVWEYSLDGSAWSALPSDISVDNAFLLAADAYLRFLPAPNSHGTAALEFRAWDGTDALASEGRPDLLSEGGGTTPYSSATGKLVHVVHSVNDAPTADNSATPTLNAIFEDEAASEGTLISSLLSQVSADDLDVGDVLGIALTAADESNGQWKFSNDGGENWIDVESVDETNAVLLSADALLRFIPAEDWNSAVAGAVAISFRVWDGSDENDSGDTENVSTNGGSTAYGADVFTATLTVDALNDVPKFAEGDGNGEFSIDEDTNLGDYLPTATDVEGDTVTYSLATGPENGEASVASDGYFTYTPNPEFYGEDTFTYTVSDGIGEPLTRTVTVQIAAVNDAPIFVIGDGDAEFYIDEDTVLSESLPPASDVEGDDVTYSLETEAANGSASVNGDGTFTYTPDENFFGDDSFTYTVSDEHEGTVTRTVTVHVSALNDAPENVLPATSKVPVGGSLVFSEATNNAVRIDDDSIGLIQVMLTVNHGTLTLSQTNGLSFLTGTGANDWFVCFTGTVVDVNAALEGLTYQADATYTGAVQFSLATQDLGGTGSGGAKADFDTATITVDYPPVNTVPIEQTTNEDSAKVFSTGNLNAISVADADHGTLTVTLAVVNGKLTLAGIGGLTFTSGDGTSDRTMTFSGATADINAALNGLSYSPNAHYYGEDLLTIKTSDGIFDDVDTVVIHVLSVNDAPSFTPGDNITVGDNVGPQTVMDWATGLSIGPANEWGQVPAFTTTNDSNGLFTAEGQPSVAADGTLTFTPAHGVAGTATVTVKLNDGGGTANGGVTEVEHTFTITVELTNDAPKVNLIHTNPSFAVLDEDQVPSETGVLVGDWITAAVAAGYLSDANGDPLGIALTGFDPGATDDVAMHWEYLLPGGDWTDVPADLADESPLILTAEARIRFSAMSTDDNGLATLAFRAWDGSDSLSGGDRPNLVGLIGGDQPYSAEVGRLVVVVRPVNDAPTASDTTATGDEDTDIDGLLIGTDVESGTLIYQVVQQPTNGTVEIHEDGSFTYSPNSDYSGTDQFTYQVFDGDLYSGEPAATVALTIVGTNDPPVFLLGEQDADVEVWMAPGGVLNSAAPPFHDVDGDTLTYAVTGSPTYGTLDLLIDGTFTYTPADAEWEGDDQFEYSVSDGQSAGISGWVTIHVTDSSPTAPAAVNDFFEVDELTRHTTGSVVANDGLYLNLPYSVAVKTGVQHGTLTLAPDGWFHYLADANYSGSDSFEYDLTINGVPTSAAVTLDVPAPPPPPAPPAANNDSYRMTAGKEIIKNVAINDATSSLSYVVTLLTPPNHGSLNLNPNGNFIYTPDPAYTGSDTFDYRLTTIRGSATATATINIVANQSPSFTKGADVVVSIDSGLTTIEDWATGVSAGTDEADQGLVFEITTDYSELFDGTPELVASSDPSKYHLRFSPKLAGEATVTVRLKDNGGTAAGGIDASALQTFTIRITEPGFQIPSPPPTSPPSWPPTPPSGSVPTPGAGAAVNPTFNRTTDLPSIQSLVVRIGAQAYDIMAGEVPVIPIDGSITVEVGLTDAAEGCTVTINWGDSTSTVGASPTVSGSHNYGSDKDDPLPPGSISITVDDEDDGNPPRETWTVPLKLNWPGGTVEVVNSEALERTVGDDEQDPIKLRFNVPEKLRHGTPVIFLENDKEAESIDWPYYYPGPDPEFDEDGDYEFKPDNLRAGTYTYRVAYGGAYGTFTVEMKDEEETPDPVLAVPSVLDEGEYAVLGVDLSDKEGKFTLEVDWGDDTSKTYSLEGGHSYTLHHMYREDSGPGPEDVYEFHATLKSRGKTVSEGEQGVRVVNVAPKFIDDPQLIGTTITQAARLLSAHGTTSRLDGSGNTVYDVEVEYEGMLVDPGVDDSHLGVGDAGVAIARKMVDGQPTQIITFLAVATIETTYPVEDVDDLLADQLLPGFTISDDDGGSTTADAFRIEGRGAGDDPDNERTVTVTAQILDHTAGEPIRMPDGTLRQEPAVVRFSREILNSDPELAPPPFDWIEKDGVPEASSHDDNKRGSTTIYYHFEAKNPAFGSNDWASGSVEIEDGDAFVDKLLFPGDDSLAEWNEKFSLIIDGWTERDPEQTDEINVGTIIVLDNDAEVALGNYNVDTGVTGLEPERVETLNGRQISLYDGTWVWYVPFGEGTLPAIYSGSFGTVVNSVTLPNGPTPASVDADGEPVYDPLNDWLLSNPGRRDIAFASDDQGLINVDDHQNLTLRRNYGGLEDLAQSAQADASTFNPNPLAGGGRMGFVDRLVPTETSYDPDITSMLGFELLRRDGTSAWYAATPTGSADEADAERKEDRATHWNFSLSSGRFYQLALPYADGDTKYAVDDKFILLKGTWVTHGARNAQTTYGASVGFVMPDADGNIEVVYNGVIDGDPSLVAYDSWSFITPEGSRSPAGEALANLSTVSSGLGGVGFELTTKYGDQYQFDGRGLMTKEMDRLGNRTEYAYEDSLQDGSRQRLTEVKYQGGLTLELTYAGHEGNALASIVDSLGRTTIAEGDELVSETPVEGDVNDAVSLRIRAGGANPTAPNKQQDPKLKDADTTKTFVTDVLDGDESGYRLAATGKIGRLHVPGNREATASFKRAYYTVGSPSFEPTPLAWTYQFDRFGLLIAEAAPSTTGNPQQDVWLWVRDDVSGFVEKYKEPAGRGYVAGLSSPGDYPPITATGPDAYFDVTYFDYYATGDLANVLYADLSAESWTYGAFHQVETHLDRNYKTRTTHRNSDGTIEYEYVEDVNEKIVYSYAPHATSVNTAPGGMIESVTAPTGDPSVGLATTTHEYFTSGPHKGLLKKILYPSTSGSINEEFTYDEFRHLRTHRDADGVLHSYRYDKLGQLLEEWVGGSMSGDNLVNGTLVAKYMYDAAGNIRAVGVLTTDGSGLAITVNEYDYYNRLTKTTEPRINGQHGFVVTEYAYYGDGLLREKSEPLNHKTQYVYDDRRQQIEVLQNVTGVVAPGGEPLAGMVPTAAYAYDAAGNLLSETVPTLAQTTFYTYDQNGRVLRKQLPDPDGQFGSVDENLPALIVKYKYDKEGNLTSETLPRSQEKIASAPSARNFYDAAGRLIRHVGAADKFSILEIEFTRAAYEAYEYYDDGSIKVIREGFTTSPVATEPAADGTLSGDTLRKLTLNTYDALGRIKSVAVSGPGIQPGTTEYAYFNAGQGPTKPIDDSRAVRFEKITTPIINGSAPVTWNYYDDLGRLIRTVHPNPGTPGLTVTSDVYEYNADGTLAKQWQEDGVDTTRRRWIAYSYDGRGRLARKYDELGTISAYTYDAADEVRFEFTASGAQIGYTYDALGRVTKKEFRDRRGKIEGLVDETFGYDVNGNRIFHTDQYGDRTDFAFDALNRITLQTEPDYSFDDDLGANYKSLKRTKYVYRGDDGSRRKIEPPGAATYYPEVDDLGRATQVRLGEGLAPRTTKYEYDPAGNVTRVEDADGSKTWYDYDGFNRVVTEWTEIGGQSTRTYQYDAAGNLIEYKDREGRVTKYQYDALGRRIDELVTNGPSYHATFTYDQAGNLVSASDANSTYAYSNYDARGRARQLVQTLSAAGFASVTTTFTYSYNDALSSSERKTGAAVSEYTVTAVSGGVQYYKNTYQFDALGREVWAEQDSPTASDKQVLHLYHSTGGKFMPADAGVTKYADRYDEAIYYQLDQSGAAPRKTLDVYTYYEEQDAGLVRRIDASTPIGATGTVVDYQYTYDKRDLLRKFIDRGGVLQSRNYDAFGQLDDGHSVYTANGNLGVGSYNRPTQIGSHYLTYYKDGGVKTDSNTAPDESGERKTVLYTWDARNRLTRNEETFFPPGDDELPAKVTTDYYYDVFNNLIAKRIQTDSKHPSRVGDVELYVIDAGQRTLTFKLKTGTPIPQDMQARYFNASTGTLYAVDARATSGSSSGLLTHWVVVDREGSVRDSYTFAFNGPNVSSYTFARFDYDDFGRPNKVADPNGHQTLLGVDPNLLQQWQGAFYDAGIEAYKFGDRWMSVSLKRWLSEDPLGLAGGPNPNAALNNSPDNFRDPDGREPITIAAFAIGALVVGGLSYASLESSQAQYGAADQILAKVGPLSAADRARLSKLQSGANSSLAWGEVLAHTSFAMATGPIFTGLAGGGAWALRALGAGRTAAWAGGSVMAGVSEKVALDGVRYAVGERDIFSNYRSRPGTTALEFGVSVATVGLGNLRALRNAPSRVATNSYDEIAAFRQRAGLQAYSPDSGDTVARVVVNGRAYHGVNSRITEASHAATKSLRERWLGEIDWVPPKTKVPQHLGQAQSLTHAESHALIRAYERQGSLPSALTMYVDRTTCNICRGEMPALLKRLGVNRLDIYSGGSSTPIPIFAAP